MNSRIQLAHGSGGGLSRDLIENEIVSRFGDGPLAGLPDAASLPPLNGAPVFTTDSFVVHPLSFPGGNIGSLAVHGTVNDLAAAGARPRYLSLALILEEGLELTVLREVLDTVRAAADACDVQIVTGDTKVVARGQGDGIYINTAGLGEKLSGLAPDPASIRVGDVILCSGPIGDHGMAVLAAREGIQLENGPVSDSAPVHRLVLNAKDQWKQIRFMRDPTRGGVAAVLNEIVDGRDVGIRLEEAAIPFTPGTQAAAEMLGMDLLSVACEGRLLVVCAENAAAPILAVWGEMPEGRKSGRIGTVTADAGRLTLQTLAGGARLVDVPQGELLPRIC